MAIIFHPKKDERFRKAKVCEKQSKNTLEKTKKGDLVLRPPFSLKIKTSFVL